MTIQHDEQRNFFAIFRCDENDGWLYDELKKGRLRQGWGAAGLYLVTKDGVRVEKKDWEQAHRKLEKWGEPSPRRFSILSQMLYLERGDIVVIPKMPQWNQFTVARVAAGYQFEHESDLKDFRHIVELDPQSIRPFGYQADDDAYMVSALFARANHRAAVTWCYSQAHLEATGRLLQRESSTSTESQESLILKVFDDALKKAAKELNEQVAKWNGQRFEDAVRQAFRNQGYDVKDRERADGKGGDADIVVTPPKRPFVDLFLPNEIAVQVKWKQDVDKSDGHAVQQIVKWADSKQSSAAKYVISSASEFTDETREKAAAADVTLISGLQTMCFLLGFPDRYRSDWEK